MYSKSHKSKPESIHSDEYERLVHFSCVCPKNAHLDHVDTILQSHHAVPQEGSYLPDSKEFDQEPFQRLCDKLKDSSPSEQVIFPDSKPHSEDQTDSVHPIPHEGSHLSELAESTHAPYQRLREPKDSTPLDQHVSPCSEYKHHPSIYHNPQGRHHLPDYREFEQEPFQRLCEKLKAFKGSSPSEQVTIPDSKPHSEEQLHSVHPIPHEGSHLSESTHASYQRLREQLKDSTSLDQHVSPCSEYNHHSSIYHNPQEHHHIPDYREFSHVSSSESKSPDQYVSEDSEHKSHSVRPASHEGDHSSESVHEPFQRLRLKLKDPSVPEPGYVRGLAALRELKEVSQMLTHPVRQRSQTSRFPYGKRSRGDADTPPDETTLDKSPHAPPPDQTTPNNDPPAPPHTTRHVIPLHDNQSASAMSVNCTSCTINYNYLPPTRYIGLLICEVAIVLVFAFYTYMFRKA